MENTYELFPAELKKLKQWVLWKMEWKEKDQRWTKIPKQITGENAEADNPQTWTNFEKAYQHRGDFSGVGFVFQKGYIGIDLDNAFKDGKLKDWAQKVVDSVQSYTEVSQSGKGIHIIVPSALQTRGVKEEWLNDDKEKEGIEFYSTTRYFVVTGNVYGSNTELKGGQDDQLKEMYEKVSAKTYSGKHKNSTTPQPLSLKKTTPVRIEGEGQILEVAYKKRNGIRTRMLYEGGDWKGAGYASQSEADLALCGTLMFFCGNNANIVDKMFRGSKLFRNKWDEKRGTQTYGEITVTKSYASKVFDWGRVDDVDNDEAEEEFEISSLDTYKTEKVDWLWKGRLAKRMITQFQGPPGTGKSQVTAYIASVISNGGTFVDGYVAEKGSVLFVISEDDISATFKPRLMAYGADLKKIVPLGLLKKTNNRSEVLNLGMHIEQLKRTIKKIPDLRLIVIDPISAFLGKVDSNSNADVRGLLAGLQTILTETNVSTIMITHNNKSAGTSALSRASGSVAFGAVARTAFMFGPNPLNPGEGTNRNFVMISLKNNLVSPPATLGYVIRGQFVQDEGGELIETSRIDFTKEDVSGITGEEVADWQPEKKNKKMGRPPELLDQCVDEIKSILEKWGVVEFLPNDRYIDFKRQLNVDSDNEYSDKMITKAMKKIGYTADFSDPTKPRGWYKQEVKPEEEFKPEFF